MVIIKKQGQYDWQNAVLFFFFEEDIIYKLKALCLSQEQAGLLNYGMNVINENERQKMKSIFFSS